MSSLAFDPPLFAEEVKSGLPAIILAVDFQGSSTLLLYADSDGYLHTGEPQDLRTDWRWDLKAEKWYDAHAKDDDEPDG